MKRKFLSFINKKTDRGAISIRTKIIKMQLLLAFVILLVCTTAFFLKDLFYFKQSVERNLESTARILGHNITPALAFSDPEQAKKILTSVQSETGIRSAWVTDPAGKVFAAYNSADAKAMLEIAKLKLKRGYLLRDNRLIFYTTLDQNDEVLGTIFLEASLEVFLAEYKVYLWIGLAVFLSGLLMSFGIAHLSHRALSEPMRSLARTASRISRSGDSSLRVSNNYRSEKIEEIEILSTEFNLMLEQIEAKEKRIEFEKVVAEKANQSKSQFLANVSHELRTPMHGILSFAKFGQQKYETSSKEKLKTYFDEIYDSGARLMNLLNDLLDLSKLEAGKSSYTMESGDLVSIARTVQSELSAFAIEKELSIEVCPVQPIVSAIFDSEKIMQVIRNVLSNAIKFSNKGSTIQIVLTDIANGIQCRVINLGVGIPDSELESIFDKFIQSTKTRTGAGGTGLGLAICREIIQQHGGRIWAEGKADGKTHFVLELLKTPIVAERNV